jgi:hypothetical protein
MRRVRVHVHPGAFVVVALAASAAAWLGIAAGSGESGAATYGAAPGVPVLRPPQVTVLQHAAGLAPGFIFLGAKNPALSGGPQTGPLIVDDLGRPVWFRPLPPGLVASDVRVQRYLGHPVLTWWQGTTLGGAGHGHGQDLIADTSYHVIARVRAGHGYYADQHTFDITPQGTALIEAYHKTRRQGREVFDGIVQEIDIPTGRVLFEWHSLDHVPMRDSYMPPPANPDVPYDYFHINSVGVAPDGNLLISSRHTWTIYEVDRHTGRIIWRLGGKHSDFKLGPDARFAWQHNPVPIGPNELRIFDNESDGRPRDPASRVITLRLDYARRTATLVNSIEHPFGLSVPSQGNSERLSNGDLFVGWGRVGRYSEFAPDGRLLLDAVFPPGFDTYRAYRFPWSAHPTTRPDVTARRDGSDTTVHAFWNGATDVIRWRILAGSTPAGLDPVGSMQWNGLDTSTHVRADAKWVEVEAEDETGSTVATSAPVRVTG